MSSSMLLAAVKRQYSSVLPLLVAVGQFLTKFVERQRVLYFYRPSNIVKIANTPLDRSAALVLSVITEHAALPSAKSG